MDLSEAIVLMASICLTAVFLYRWYRFIFGGAGIRHNAFARAALGLMPVFSLAIILYALVSLASFDVVGGWVIFYALLGFAWLYFGMFLMFFFFDLSWIDDALNMSNPAAALAVLGGGLGVTLIYAGANVGDGPGWWCVVLAGGLGTAAWAALGVIANAIAKVFGRITTNRDVLCGARTGAYLLSSGIVLGRAVAGDWTSFSKTIAEFGDGWPVLLLTAAFIMTELLFINSEKQKEPSKHNGPREQSDKSIRLSYTLILCAAYIAAAFLALKMLPPLPVNPIYRQ